MATRTISNAGGNYNSTLTWVQGIVPNSADDINATATSGQLTINVTAAARNFDLTNYNNTITFNATWNVSGAFNNTISATTNFAGAGAWTFSGNGGNMTMNTTNRIPNLNLSGTKTFTTNWFCVNCQTTSGPSLNSVMSGFFEINISGNIGRPVDITLGAVQGIRGDVVFKMTGNGFVNFSYGGGAGRFEINTTGTYSCNQSGLCMHQNLGTPTFKYVSGGLSAFRISLSTAIGSVTAFNIETGTGIIDTLILLNQFVSVNRNCTINIRPLNGVMNCRNIAMQSRDRMSTSDVDTTNFRFTGGSLSASNVCLLPTFRANSGASEEYIYKGPNFSLDSGFTHTIGALQCVGMLQTGSINVRPTISSITASSAVNINLISKTSSQCVNYNFTDVNAVGDEIVAIGGTLLRTTNVTNIYPTGGTGGGGGGETSHTFVN